MKGITRSQRGEEYLTHN